MRTDPERFDIQTYMTQGVERVVGDIVKATFRNPKESAYMARFALASRAASRKRRKAEDAGEHIPPFLIASITSQCNLHCAGCYSRCNHATVDAAPVCQLTAEEWQRIFAEADEMGISFILLAGGEPMMRRDIIEMAGKHPNILFPIFTNGTCMDEPYFRLFDKYRNLVPILSIEGEKEITDARRGDRGCKAVIFVEFVPVTEESRDLAPGDAERAFLSAEIDRLREQHPAMVYISFPGDEKSSGGCVAAGRGFFHINSHGGAEPCPFSPYSDINVRDTSLREALRSPLFQALQNGGLLNDDHEGGCVLYEKRAQVEALMNQTNKERDGRETGGTQT